MDILMIKEKVLKAFDTEMFEKLTPPADQTIMTMPDLVDSVKRAGYEMAKETFIKTIKVLEKEEQ